MEGKIKNFYELNAWQKARILILEIYKISDNFPQKELFGIVSQIRRAVISIAANIAEGFERYHFNDKVRFYYQARGSAAEVLNFLILSMDLNYIDKETCKILGEKTKEVSRLINGLINSIDNQK